MSCAVTEQYADMLSKWPPVLASVIIDEATQSLSFQPQIMCLGAGLWSLMIQWKDVVTWDYRQQGG